MSDRLRFPGNVTLTAAAGKNKPQRVYIVAYTGAVMEVAGFGPVLIDLKGLSLPSKLNLLGDHEPTLRGIVGTGEPKVEGGQLIIRGQLLDTAGGRAVRDLLLGGSPLQASIGAQPIDRARIAEGSAVAVNGQTVQAGRGGFWHIQKARLREVSILPLGADAATSVSLAAKRGTSMHFTDWLTAKGFDDATLTETQRATLRATYDAEGRIATPVLDSHMVLGEERQRIAGIDRVCRGDWGEHAGRVEELRAQAIDSTLSLETLQGELLGIIRGRRAESTFVPRSSARTATRPDVLTAACLLHMGRDEVAVKSCGADTTQRARDLGCRSLLDLCAVAVRGRGEDVPRETNQLIRAAIGTPSTYSLSVALGNAANKTLLDAYMESPQTWRAFASIRSTVDFKENIALRGTALEALRVVPPGGELKHTTISEETYTFSVNTFGEILGIDRRSIINDDLSLFDSTAQAMGRAAQRSVSDLAYRVFLANTLFFTSGHANVVTGAGSALSVTSLGAAITKMRQQTDANGNAIDIMPRTLLVPPSLEHTARGILSSGELYRTTTDQLTGNPMQNVVTLQVEPRLEISTYTGYSSTGWYLLSSPADAVLLVAFLDGKQIPTVEFFGFDSDPRMLTATWRCYMDYGSALGDYRAGVRAAGV